MEDVEIDAANVNSARNPSDGLHEPVTVKASPHAIVESSIKEEKPCTILESNYALTTSATDAAAPVVMETLPAILEDSTQQVYESAARSYNQSRGTESTEALILPLTQSGLVTSSHEMVQSTTTDPVEEFGLAVEPQKEIFNLQPLVAEEGQATTSIEISKESQPEKEEEKVNPTLNDILN
jgi:hypothetical protein